MNRKVMKLASPGKRLGAYCIDKIVPIVLLCVVIAIAVKLSTYSGWDTMYGYSYGYNWGSGAMSVLGTAVSFLVVMGAAVAYIAVQVFFYTKSKTIGKAILGLQVISSDNGEPIGVFKMLLREWFAKKASGAIFLLGYLWILIDDKNRGWHDKIMDTYVVDLVETAKHNQSEKQNESEVNSGTDSVNETEIQDVDNVNPEGGTIIGEY